MKKFLLFMLILFISTATAAPHAYTSPEMKQLEREFLYQIYNSNKLIRSPLALAYIQHLGRTLTAHASKTGARYTFFLVNSSEINAFAGPGGYIGINSGLIFQTVNESELAAVMSHEIVHVQQDHLLKSMQREKNMRIPMLASTLASIALGVLNPALGSGALLSSLSGYAQQEINYTRSNEKEADRLGIKVLYESGFDPNMMAEFFKKLQQQDRYRDMSNIPAILLTHPLDEARIADAENRAALFPKKHYTSSQDYYLFKEIVRASITATPQALTDYYKKKLAISPHEDALHFGYGLALIKNFRFEQAKQQLQPLAIKNPDNIYYQVGLANAEFGVKNFAVALQIMDNLYKNHPDNYAIIYEYTTMLIQLKQYQHTENILIACDLNDPNSVIILQRLSQVQALNKQVAQAYLTKARMMLILGQNHRAIFYLKQAQHLAGDNHLLLAQISATLDEAK